MPLPFEKKQELIDKRLSEDEQLAEIENDGMQPDLWNELVIARDESFGGPSMLGTGRTGSGKTSLQCRIADVLLKGKKSDGERLWWAGRNPCQWQRLGVDKCMLHISDREVVKFARKSDGGGVEEFEPEHSTFRTFKELYKNASSDKLNVVYMPIEDWILFMQWLCRNSWDWNSLFFDEVEDFLPENAPGDAFNRNRAGADIVKELRKHNISLYCNTQGVSDVSYMARSKIMLTGLLMGAPHPKNSPVFKRAMRKLDVGEGWLFTGGHFQKINFPPYLMPKEVIKAKTLTYEIESIERLKKQWAEKQAERRERARTKYNLDPQKMVEMFDQGMGPMEIARKLGLYHQLVCDHLNRRGRRIYNTEKGKSVRRRGERAEKSS